MYGIIFFFLFFFFYGITSTKAFFYFFKGLLRQSFFQCYCFVCGASFLFFMIFFNQIAAHNPREKRTPGILTPKRPTSSQRSNNPKFSQISLLSNNPNHKSRRLHRACNLLRLPIRPKPGSLSSNTLDTLSPLTPKERKRNPHPSKTLPGISCSRGSRDSFNSNNISSLGSSNSKRDSLGSSNSKRNSFGNNKRKSSG